jgi:hypothetical protein
LADTAGGWPLALEKWGIAAVCALAALALWKRLDVADKAKIELHREALDLQKRNSQELVNLTVQSHEAMQATVAAVAELNRMLGDRPCQCDEMLRKLKEKYELK